MGAVLATGPHSVLSHRAAAALHSIHASERLEVTSPRYCARPGIRIHTSPLILDEVTVVRGVPVTTVPRTLLDLAVVLPAHQVERAANEAQYRGHADALSLDDMVARYPRRQGIKAIRAILARLSTGVVVTRSELEALFLSFIARSGLPAPDVNVPLQLNGTWIECDCLWRDQRLIVELDGHAAHATTASFERDRARDRTLNADGWRTVRVTWRQLHEDVELLAADLKRILAMPSRAPRQSARARAAGP